MLNIFKKPKLKVVIAALSVFLILILLLVVVFSVNARPKNNAVTTNAQTTLAAPTLPVVKEPTIYDYLRFETNSSGCTLMSIVDYPNEVLLIPAETEDGVQITAIGDGAFKDCRTLREITIPATVKRIGNASFAGASSLVAVNVEPANPYYCSVGGVLFTRDKTELICYPAAKVGENYLLNTNVKVIAPYAFDGVYNLKAILYEGSASKYQSIEIGSGNGVFSSLPVTCNYTAAK